MGNTTVAAWFAAALLACTASAFAEEPFALYDANGVRMGRMGYDAVQLTVNGQQYFVRVANYRHSTSELDFAPYQIYFESNDCTGKKVALLEHSYGAPFAVAQVEQSGRVLLRPAAKRGRPGTVYSFLRKGGSCGSTGISTLVVELLDPIDITDLYARPFTVR